MEDTTSCQRGGRSPALRVGSIGLIFLDQSVHKQLTGTETVREMRRRGIQSRVCGLSANDLVNSFVQAGADAFWHKPIPCKSQELKAALLQIHGK